MASDTDPATVSPAILGIAIISRMVDTHLAVLAGDSSNAAAEDGPNTQARDITRHPATGAVRVVDADLALVALDRLDAEAAAGLVGRLGHVGLRLGHQGGGGGRGSAIAVAVQAAVAVWSK